MAVLTFFWIGIFVVSLLVLLKSSDYFTTAAEKIGLLLGMPAFIVGVTIVAIGTSLPELISSFFAVAAGNSEMVAGNVVGSNIANILLILGFVAIVGRKVETKYEILKVDLPIFFASALFVFISCMDGVFNFWEGIIGILGVIVYFSFAVNSAKKSGSKQKITKKEKKTAKKEGFWSQIGIMLIAGIFIFLGAKYVVASVINLSTIFNIGTEVIAISAVAIGTSLPELMVGYQAAKRGNAGLAFGNVLGSNIFNSFAVLGIPALFGAIVIPSAIVQFSIPVMIGVSLLYFFMIQDKQLTIWEGLILLLAYILYLAKIFALF
ncbi:calcium/sodium antiporter [archaeon]|jgi:cation:H+ antiporter|nr:calcium/sodium antiporter [archaeon]MBT4397683.1 calcium/sodium antiporter [archaeon]MBT4441621.1 calcium/sodium antiporter [archaeon]